MFLLSHLVDLAHSTIVWLPAIVFATPCRKSKYLFLEPKTLRTPKCRSFWKKRSIRRLDFRRATRLLVQRSQ